ncbi:HDOD domain-containing protein [uncultured Desulfobacter sp.]|uniref:HDOD domain-containing protein n=1 Tax=uncultured Desulfobacter sp. TaxID=240139 RepID=UPI002AAB7BC8|nr:HDOD domain-containing protein [uncultured Desulfobacter sp.]
MVLTLCVAGSFVLLVIAFLLYSKKSRSADNVTELYDPMPIRTSPDDGPVTMPGRTDDYKAPEFEYSVLKEGFCPAEKKDLGDELLNTIHQKLKTLTPPSSAAFKILKLIDDPHVKNKDLASIVTTDPVFSANVLKVVNSAYFNRPTEITSVGTAILFMGYHNFRSMVMEYNLRDVLPKTRDEAQKKEYNNLWLHSTVVSACAFYLGHNIFHHNGQELATIGLLHDIGKYYLPLFETKAHAPEGTSSCIEEDCLYGFNHADLGGYIAQEWRLPRGIASVIHYHHYPHFFPPEEIPREYRMLSFIICLADLICKGYGYHGKGEQILPIREEYFEMYDIDLKRICSKDLEEEIEKARYTVESFIKQ